jgi:hypothetical protein
MDFDSLSQPLVHEYENENRDGKPKDIRDRRTEKIKYEREWKREYHFPRQKRDEDTHDHPDHEHAHHEQPPKKVVGSVRDMKIEKMLIDGGQKHEQYEKEDGIGIWRIGENGNRNHTHERESDVDIDEDIDELIAAENESCRHAESDEQQDE